jgi:hypothetical protein
LLRWWCLVAAPSSDGCLLRWCFVATPSSVGYLLWWCFVVAPSPDGFLLWWCFVAAPSPDGGLCSDPFLPGFAHSHPGGADHGEARRGRNRIKRFRAGLGPGQCSHLFRRILAETFTTPRLIQPMVGTGT